VIRITQRIQYKYNYASTAALAPDWDLVEEIMSQIRRMPVKAVFHHVKEHQGDHVPYRDLSIDAQLNGDADALAGEYMTSSPESHLIAPMMPPTGTLLVIQNKTIKGPLLKQNLSCSCHFRNH
jgi:hypothetical protein